MNLISEEVDYILDKEKIKIFEFKVIFFCKFKNIKIKFSLTKSKFRMSLIQRTECKIMGNGYN